MTANRTHTVRSIVITNTGEYVEWAFTAKNAAGAWKEIKSACVEKKDVKRWTSIGGHVFYDIITDTRQTAKGE